MAGLVVAGLLVALSAACLSIREAPGGQAPEERGEAWAMALKPPAQGPDLAVTAIDFEPPLRPYASFSSGDILLLAAVENKGDRREADVRVVAQVFGKEEELLYSDARSFEALAAGESRVVKFGPLSGLPLRSSYILNVWAVPVSGESILDNNGKTFRIQVSVSTP